METVLSIACVHQLSHPSANRLERSASTGGSSLPNNITGAGLRQFVWAGAATTGLPRVASSGAGRAMGVLANAAVDAVSALITASEKPRIFLEV